MGGHRAGSPRRRVRSQKEQRETHHPHDRVSRRVDSCEPTNAELAAKLGLKTEPRRTHYDLVLAGGGLAGLTAALYAAREEIDTLVTLRLEKKNESGRNGQKKGRKFLPPFF